MSEELCCVYCLLDILPTDDGQRIEQGMYAHTACAYRAADGDLMEQQQETEVEVESRC